MCVHLYSYIFERLYKYSVGLYVYLSISSQSWVASSLYTPQLPIRSQNCVVTCPIHTMIYPRFSAEINSPSLMICDAAISALHTKFALKSATRLALDARLITTDSAIQYVFLNMAAFNVFSGLGIFV